MKLFVDRHKTLLPRVDFIYFLTRVMVLASLVCFLLFRDLPEGDHTLFYVFASIYGLHLILFFIAIKGKFDVKLAYLSAIIIDIIQIPLLALFTGLDDSAFYLLSFLTVSIAGYVLTTWFSLAVAVMITLVLLGLVSLNWSFDNLFSTSFRIGFLWVYYLAILYAADYMRRSERRLLKLFDTLNQRTSELEKSQAHLEMIYENTRILASLLDTESVIREVMRIMGKVLQYGVYAVIFRDKNGTFYYRGRHVDGQNHYHLKAMSTDRTGLLEKLAGQQESIVVKEVSKRDDFQVLNAKSRSAMLVPLVTHGHCNGFLAAEAEDNERFKERDLQMVSAVARSAALALENAELHKRTEELTLIDELTETFNYRYFVQKLQEEKRRSTRYDLPLSLIMVDIDWFKKLNDSYGHEVGNLVLKRLSGIIKQCIRDVDIFARYGGEEFAIILPQTPQKDALVIGERIRNQVEQEIFQSSGSDKLKITVSVGVSSFPENGRSQEELVSVADQALYRAKGEGRNLVCVK